MRKISKKEIEAKINSWETYFSKNNERGKKFIRFGLAGDQWESGIPEKRQRQNKESITANLSYKVLKRFKSQNKEIEFSLDISPTNKEAQENVEESNVFRLLLSSIMLNNRMLNTFANASDKMAQYGYCAVEINFERENNETLNCLPVARLIKDPSTCFWDKNAIHPQKIDGRYCGIKKDVSKAELIIKYPSLKNSSIVKPKHNILVDYWYREYKDMDFVLLKSGEYKRKDLLSLDDKNNIAKKSDTHDMKFENYDFDGEIELVKKCAVSCIYFKRLVNSEEIEKPCKFPTDDLPLMYHDGLTFWHPDDGDFTTPLVYHLEGMQKLHNYTISQIATQAKNSSGDKWLMNPSHVPNPSQQAVAKKINTIEGAIVLNDDLQKIRREQGSQLSQSLLELAQSSKNEIEEISGAMISQANPQQTVLSGAALDKFTHSMNAINLDVVANHIYFVNTAGILLKQMIPRIVTEERTLIIKKQDGSGEAITVNQYTETGAILNNIKDINSNFDYQIIASPNSAMQKENIVRYITQILQINPQLFSVLGDIFMRSLDTPDASEMERRVAATMDNDLILYSQGAITQQEFQSRQKQKQKQQMEADLKNKKMMSELDPQVKSSEALAAAEHKKADAMQFGKETDRMSAAAKAETDSQNVGVKIAQALLQAGNQHFTQQISSVESQRNATQQMIDNSRQLLQDEQAQNQQQQQPQGENPAPQQSQDGAQDAAAAPE